MLLLDLKEDIKNVKYTLPRDERGIYCIDQDIKKNLIITVSKL